MNKDYRNFLLTHAGIIAFAIVVAILAWCSAGCRQPSEPAEEPQIEVHPDSVLYPGLGQ